MYGAWYFCPAAWFINNALVNFYGWESGSPPPASLNCVVLTRKSYNSLITANRVKGIKARGYTFIPWKMQRADDDGGGDKTRLRPFNTLATETKTLSTLALPSH